MARVQKFDRSDVLDKALNLFWLRGYEATSISKLLDVMDLNRGSLYCAFKDKRSLYQEVLGHYYQGLRENLFIPTLVDISDPLESFREFFYRGLLDGSAPIRARGCLLFNAVSELSHNDPGLSDDASSYIFELRSLFVKKLSEARTLGLSDASKSIETQADFLLGILAGLRLQSKMGFNSDVIKEAIDSALSCIFTQTVEA
jgi:TetR/AcrR family transcriptional repressor of nem operon